MDRLLTLGRLEEAIAEAELAKDHELLELADIFCHHDLGQGIVPVVARRVEAGGNHRLMEWLKEHHLEQGRLPEALDLAKRLLEQRPSLSGYAEVRELSRQLGAWEELRSQLLGRWSAAGEYGLLTDIHVEEGETDLALRSAAQGPSGLQGGNRLTRVAEAAAAIRPQAALDIYRRQAEGPIAARGRGKLPAGLCASHPYPRPVPKSVRGTWVAGLCRRVERTPPETARPERGTEQRRAMIPWRRRKSWKCPRRCRLLVCPPAPERFSRSAPRRRHSSAHGRARACPSVHLCRL